MADLVKELSVIKGKRVLITGDTGFKLTGNMDNEIDATLRIIRKT